MMMRVMSRSAVRGSLRVAGRILSSAGVAGLLWYGINFAQRTLAERRAEHAFEERLAAASQAIARTSTGDSDEQTNETNHQPRRVAPARADESVIFGRIQIPRVRVSAIVREGVDARTLESGAGHVPGTAFFGEPGNVALAAHRDRHFRGLRNIRPGDEISVETMHRTYHYVVESTQVVQPTEVGVLDPTPDPSITLITCYPFFFLGPAPERFIVRARQVDAKMRAAAGS